MASRRLVMERPRAGRDPSTAWPRRPPRWLAGWKPTGRSRVAARAAPRAVTATHGAWRRDRRRTSWWVVVGRNERRRVASTRRTFRGAARDDDAHRRQRRGGHAGRHGDHRPGARRRSVRPRALRAPCVALSALPAVVATASRRRKVARRSRVASTCGEGEVHQRPAVTGGSWNVELSGVPPTSPPSPPQPPSPCPAACAACHA